MQIYEELLFKPMLNLLIAVYNVLPWADLGIAIIVVTILIRLLLFPLAQRSIKSQKALQDLQPQIDEIRSKYDDKQEQAKKTMEFYQENKINPLGSCLPLLIQLPIIFALYQVFRAGLSDESLEKLYDFVARPDVINTTFLGLVNLSETNVLLAVTAGALQFVQTRMLQAKRKQPEKKKSDKPASQEQNIADMSSAITKQMTYFMPIITVFIGMSLPAGLTLYWVVVTLFAIGQQYILTRKDPKPAA